MVTMKKQLVLLSLALGLGAAFAQNPVDPYMGDWKGTVSLGAQKQDVVVAMIPLGSGHYEAKIMSTFDRRVPVLFDLRGLIRGDDFKFADAIPFEVNRIVDVTSQGVIVSASLWAGKVKTGSVSGAIAGKLEGQFHLTQFQRTSPTMGAEPPTGAVVLFDGQNLDAWQSHDGRSPAQWKIVNDAVQVGGGDIMTKQKFGAVKLHLEFRTPYMPTASGQGRGNSGVYLLGHYELQVLDSYGLEGADNECGGIYQVSRPAVNACFPPLQWQTYDITFHPAQFDASGSKTADARITVVQNGLTIQDNVKLPHPTGGALDSNEKPPGPLLLQDHGNPVQYRNIWLQNLD